MRDYNTFLLSSSHAHSLYEKRKNDPIIDYHTHLSVREILEDKPFNSLAQIWLQEDHYKWRLMRQAGIPEKWITGDGSDKEKILALAKTCELSLGNPVADWIHLELKSFFDIDLPFNQTNALTINDEIQSQLKQRSITPRLILNHFHVESLCTTDDPADSLALHSQLKEDSSFKVKVVPTWRPDLLLNPKDPILFLTWMDQLATQAGSPIRCLESLEEALKKRHHDFHSLGCRLSDRGTNFLGEEKILPSEVELLMKKIFNKEYLSSFELERWHSYWIQTFSLWELEKGWTAQIHFGPLRSVNRTLAGQLGPNRGFDTIGVQIPPAMLVNYLDCLYQMERLPKTIVYPIHPMDFDLVANICGAFPAKEQSGWVRLGPSWWFNDHVRGNRILLEIFAEQLCLGLFPGMLTDGRSFLSMVRHDYFRRIACDFVADLYQRFPYFDLENSADSILKRIFVENPRSILS